MSEPTFTLVHENRGAALRSTTLIFIAYTERETETLGLDDLMGPENPADGMGREVPRFVRDGTLKFR